MYSPRHAEMSVRDWTPTADEHPPEGVEVDAMDSGGHVQPLVYADNLWWFPDRSMYVYFVPLFWRALEPAR